MRPKPPSKAVRRASGSGSVSARRASRSPPTAFGVIGSGSAAARSPKSEDSPSTALRVDRVTPAAGRGNQTLNVRLLRTADLHFNPAGYHELGKRYGERMLALLRCESA